MKAGAAERDVTPPIGTIINHPPRKSIGVHDPLFVRALVLDDQAGTAVCILCCDLIGSGFDVAKELSERIRAKLGIQHLLLNCSHPHSSVGLGPRLPDGKKLTDDDKWNLRTHDAIMDMLTEARDSAVPVTLRAGRAPAQVGFNRRVVKDDGFVTMDVNRRGPVVPWVNVLLAETLDSAKPVALLFQHAAHPVIAPDTSCLISADYPGAAVAYIHEQLGDDVVALFGQGCAGNINGYHLRSTHENADKAGRDLGAAAINAMREATTIHADKIIFRHAHSDLPAHQLPTMQVWQQVVDHITAAYEKHDNPWLPEDVYRARMRGFEDLKAAITRGDTPPPWRIDAYALMLVRQWCLIALSQETFCQYELWIDHAAPFDRTMTFGYTNGCDGYIAVDADWAMGEKAGYEAACLPNWGGCDTATPHFGPPAVGGEQIIKNTITACWTDT